MTQIMANGIRLEYDTFGERAARPLLLVMGWGAQLIHWREEFCRLLADAGHFVVRFDNRDAGLSEKLEHLGVPDVAEIFMKTLQGEPVTAPYTLNDMAADAFGLLDALDIESAHVCGASMGGMIAQTMAVNGPARVRSLTSIMSSTGNPELPSATEEATAAMLSPPATNREEAIERALKVYRVIGSPGYPARDEEVMLRAGMTFDRCFYPEGPARQIAAIAALGNRRPHLEAVTAPTLVIHGKADPLVPVEGGIDTHEAISGSRLMLIDGMGHDLPEPLWPEIVGAIAELTASAESRPAAAAR